MTTRLRTMAAVVFVLVVLAGGWFAYWHSQQSDPANAAAYAQSVAQSGTDKDVCAAIENSADYQATNKAVLDVENEALTAASPQVRDAYVAFRDAWDGLTPDPLHNALATAALHFHQVCAAVRARS